LPGRRPLHRAGLGEHVVISTPAQSQYAASELYGWLKARIADRTLPAPSSDSYFALYLPPGVSVTMGGATSCAALGGFGGYHDWLSLDAPSDGGAASDGGAGAGAAYGVIVECADGRLFLSASHERGH